MLDLPMIGGGIAAVGVMGLFLRNALQEPETQNEPDHSNVKGGAAIAETLAGFENVGQTGLIAPKGTPRPILDKLRNTLVKVMNTPEIEALFAEQGAAAGTSTPEEFRKNTGLFFSAS